MKLSLLLWLTSVLPQPVADQACLATTVYLEARNQPTLGQRAVAEVALRRWQRETQGESLCKVVRAPHQFALTTVPHNFDVDNLPAFGTAWKIAGHSIQNWELPAAQRIMLVPHADHFARIDATPAWRMHGHTITVIGKHRFYALN